MKEKKIENWLQSRSYLQALILDSLINKEEKTFQDVFDYSIQFYSKLHYNLPAKLITIYLKELEHLELVEITKTPKNGDVFHMFNLQNASCKITELGLAALRNQSFHGVATSAFLHRQAITLTKRVLFLSIITAIIALVSIFISTSKPEKMKYEKLINAIESNYKGDPITIKVDSIQFKTLLKNQQKEDTTKFEK